MWIPGQGRSWGRREDGSTWGHTSAPSGPQQVDIVVGFPALEHGMPRNPGGGRLERKFMQFFLEVKNLPAVRETWVRSLDWEDPLEESMATHSRILPGESYGQRSLVGCSPRGRKESDTTE